MEKDYLIIVRGTVEQKFHVKAECLDDATDQAKERFDIGVRQSGELYKEDVVSAAWADSDEGEL
jgi:hypothetical protein